jgi:hypothetical protein
VCHTNVFSGRSGQVSSRAVDGYSPPYIVSRDYEILGNVEFIAYCEAMTG